MKQGVVVQRAQHPYPLFEVHVTYRANSNNDEDNNEEADDDDNGVLPH